jgi:hypothetical protein
MPFRFNQVGLTVQFQTAVDLLADEPKEPRGTSPKPANSSLRKPSKRRPRAWGSSLVISMRSAASYRRY